MVRCVTPVSRSFNVASTLFNIQFYIHTTVPLQNASVQVLEYFNPQTNMWMDVCTVAVTSYLCNQQYYSDQKGNAYFCLPFGQFRGTISYEGYYDTFQISIIKSAYFDMPFFFTYKNI